MHAACISENIYTGRILTLIHSSTIMQYLLTLLFTLTALLSFSQTTVTFQVDDLPEDDLKHVGIRGSIPPLDWGKSIPLEKRGDGYVITLEFEESGEELEFKFVRYKKDRDPTWESIANRTFNLLSDSSLVSENHWNREQVVDISQLTPISSAALLEDFELIKTMVLDVHPGTYRYNSEEEIEAALAKLKTAFGQPNTPGEAYLAISELTATLQCDHTKAGFNNQNKEINSIIHYQKDKLPFTFYWLGDIMVVLENASENELLTRGTQVLTINGVAVADIQAELLKYVGADGATDGNRRYKLQVNGYDFRYNAFDIFYPLAFPIDTDSLTLELLEYGQEESRVAKVIPQTREERAVILADRYPDFPATRDDMWKFEIKDHKVGILTLNSFGLYGWKAMTLDYKQFLADAFSTLADSNIQYLVIDIRENTGGNDEMADELFSYLAETKPAFEREGRTRYVHFPESLKPHVQTWGDNPWYFDLNPVDPEPTDGYYIFKENFNSESTRSDKAIYQGRVFMLTGAANTSLAFYTAYRFQQQKLGWSIGLETGGNLNDINGGQILFLRLPNSGIEIDFPVMGGFSNTPQPNTGVKPDTQVFYYLDFLKENRDREMEEVMEWVR